MNFTNIYAATHILTHSSYADSDGSWRDTTTAEIESLLALFIHFGLVCVSNVEQYWSCKALYQGLWARRMMSRNRFKALLPFFHLVDPGQEVEGDRLRKVRYTYEAIRQKCRELYQPSQNVSVDERMIRFKGRHIMKVYIKNKPTKWGFKSFALCDSSNHYHWNFELYTGQGPAASEYGKTYDLVLRLLQPLLDQGYHLYTDNYYTSNDLATSLLARQTHLVGTVRANRTGFPVALKNVKHFERTAVRGELRYVRNGPIVHMQWLDKRVVSLLSTLHIATNSFQVERKVKVGGVWQLNALQAPVALGHTTTTWVVSMTLITLSAVTAFYADRRSHGEFCFMTFWKLQS